MIREDLREKRLFFDGGMGTLLQEKGLKAGELPEIWNLEHSEEVISIHQAYIEAGSDIILTNTFGANALKFHDGVYSLEEITKTAVAHGKEAVRRNAGGRNVYVALDVGPTGKLLKPMGDLAFEEAYEAFREVMQYGEEAGADLIHIETMSDTYEIKAAVLAAKENTNLPVFVTAVFDERKKLLTGADVPAFVSLLEGLRVDALGINCGMGPEQMIPILEELQRYSSTPVIVKPNAGLPKQRDGETVFDVEPDAFAQTMRKIAGSGAAVIGGCCGTTPEHIRAMTAVCLEIPYEPAGKKNLTMVSSYGKTVIFGEESKIIGERINPTGKKKFKQALVERDMDYILREGIRQEDNGAHILDVNVGLPDIDEVSMMKEAVTALQGVTSLPLQIDTVDPRAMEEALRVYNGKPMVNSVSGKQESMDAVFPLIQKYGGVVVGLTLDETGIPETADGRVEIAERILKEAEKYGIEKKDIVIDVLAMTVSSEPQGAIVTLEALRRVRRELGVHTVLGVSNISFGLPFRPVINANFYTLALYNGLSAGIINPSSEDMMQSYDAYHALMGLDENCSRYVAKYGAKAAAQKEAAQREAAQKAMTQETAKSLGNAVPGGEKGAEMLSGELTLKTAIERGLKEEAPQMADALLKTEQPLEIINTYLIPALDHVGKGFEEGTVFLPQLLMSADAAKAAFEVLKAKIASEESGTEKKEKIILATVKGDIHDIGKNIVKVLLENYSFDVIDLGKDVAPELILQTAKEQEVRLVGLSALMTTTVASMEETIRLLKKELPECKIMVGGAVLNQEYADMIGADFYGKDAMKSVYYAQELLK